MSGFGKRQAVSASVRSAASVPVGEAGSANEPLPFSFIGLAGAAAVSTMLAFWAFYVNYPLMRWILTASPELSQSSSDHVKFALSMLKWSTVVAGCVCGVIYCVIAHWVAYFLGRSDLWIFALTGLAWLLFAFFVAPPTAPEGFQIPAGLQRPLLANVLSVVSGPATTSIYWLIAKWRAA